MANKDDHKLPLGDIVGGKWKVLAKLGEGGFGAVYKVVSIRTTSKDEYAMKVESVKTEEALLKMEAAVLKTFRNSKTPQPHVCKYIESGGTTRILYLVMQLVGQSVADLRRARKGGRFSDSTAARIGIQALEAIEALHRIGFVHRDIKPANFSVGLPPEQRTVFILDFGLARQYLTPDGQMRSQRPVAGFRGTVRYASINTHMRKDLGRHDDLWSLFYVLVEFHRGKLPWKKVKDKDEVLKMKMTTKIDPLCKGMEKEYPLMANNLQGLSFLDTPNYAWFYMQRHLHQKSVSRRQSIRLGNLNRMMKPKIL